jgi:hypothetical protein
MRIAKTLAVTTLAFACIAAASPADARRFHHHHHRGIGLGIVIGAPLLAYSYAYGRPYYRPYYDGYYAYPPVAQPPVYMEQQPGPAAAAPGYWYYCAESNAYYPYVQQCAGQWQQVAPRPSQ